MGYKIFQVEISLPAFFNFFVPEYFKNEFFSKSVFFLLRKAGSNKKTSNRRITISATVSQTFE